MGHLAPKETVRTPFIEHIYELRKRLLICAVFVAIGAGVGYSINEQLLAIIQQPLGQKLFYTSPTGGFSFVFMLCVFFGVVFALPCIIYQIIAFLKPVLPHTSRRSMLLYPLCSVILAALGITFAYFISLPASLHFLANFGGGNIEALITTDTYFNFALSYIMGFAILFQLPLLLTIANRITPLKPGKLMKWQRYVIIGSFIGAAMITPTPDPFNQLLMAGPIIILYQLSIVLIWVINKGRHKKVMSPVTSPETTADLVVDTIQSTDLKPVPASLSLVLPDVPQRTTTPSRRLISDISDSRRSFRRQTKRSISPNRQQSAQQTFASTRSNRPPTQWSGGLLDIVR